jgi:hypothetical protein
MIERYEQKMTWLISKHEGCSICEGAYPWPRPLELHHALCHNTKWARARYPKFIDSVWNLRPVHHECHMMWPSKGKIPEHRVALIERGLDRHPSHAKEVNG